LPKRGNPSLRKREVRRDFTNRCCYYFETINIFREKTFMLLFSVSEEKNRWLQEKMEALGVHERDIEERFVRSSGSGGQKVNKTSTCVYLKHIPTGIEVKWMRERSQSLNRFLARRELVTKIEKLSGQLTHEDIKIEKTKRQKLKRKKRAKIKYGKMTGLVDQK